MKGIMLMMPLKLGTAGEQYTIQKIGGKDEIKKHLENLGFVVGGDVQIISQHDGNVIVNVKGARIAISKELSMKIMV